MENVTQIYFKTPDETHFFQYLGERVKLVTLHEQAPAVEMLRYEPGLFWQWGCVAATEAEFDTALEKALNGLDAVPKL